MRRYTTYFLFILLATAISPATFALSNNVTKRVFLPLTTVELLTVPELPTGFHVTPILSGLNLPTAFALTRDNHMFIAEKSGKVRVATHGNDSTYTLLDTPFIDLSAEVNNFSDAGLLSVVPHPDFPKKPFVYVYYVYKAPGTAIGTQGGGVGRLLRIKADPANPFIAATTPDAITIIVGKNSTANHIGDALSLGGTGCQQANQYIADCIPVDFGAHAGGEIAFGRDAALYLSIGDGAGFKGVDQRALRAQDLRSLSGKLIRVNPETGAGYTDNPFFDGDVNSNQSKVWAYGFRSPFRIATHPTSNDIYVGDVGFSRWEEVNIVRQDKPRNFGWPCYEGGMNDSLRQSGYEQDANTKQQCSGLYDRGVNAVSPAAYAWKQDRPGAAVILGDFYTGGTWPTEFQHALFFADHNLGWIKAMQPNGDVKNFAAGYKGVVDIKFGVDGDLYFISIKSGEIYRIRYGASFNKPPIAGATASLTAGEAPLLVQFSAANSYDPDQQALTYLWQFGDGETSTQANPSKRFTKKGVYNVKLIVTDSEGATGQTSLMIDAGNNLPQMRITAPDDGRHYNVREVIQFSGSAKDSQDGDLSAQLRWTVNLLHNDHKHFDEFTAVGATGRFVVPDHGDNTSLELCASVIDDDKYTAQKCISLFPNDATLTLKSFPSGLNLIYAGSLYKTPAIIQTIQGSSARVTAPPNPDCIFKSWSDGGEASHNIVISQTSQTVKAIYQCASTKLILFTSGFETTDPPSNPPDMVDYLNGGLSNIGGICCGLSGPELGGVYEQARTGQVALRYSGYDNSAQASYVYFSAFDVNLAIDVPVTLSYWIYPQSSDMSNKNSTCVALDLVLDDGTRLREAGVLDQAGNRFHPQGQCGKLKLNEWNHVEVKLGAAFIDKKITKILVGYDQPNNTGAFRGYIDDISLKLSP
ncbi:MAG: PQQ-dependent sugar dehydrogenase [Anaerolineae bacterium]|nr:PQQ-dependent sugar dehydrogenase [Anaerolineae bacterium]